MDIREFSMDLFSLDGKAAIVTGGNTGLGQAFSLALAKAGANMFIPTVMDDDGETRQLIEAEGRRAEIVTIDITEDGAPKAIVDSVRLLFGSRGHTRQLGRNLQHRTGGQVRPQRSGTR